MTGVILVDVRDCLIHTAYDLDGHLIIQILLAVVFLGGGQDIRAENRAGFLTAVQAYIFGVQLRLGERQEFLCDVSVHEQGLRRIADGNALRLGVVKNVQRHIEIRGGIHIDVAIAGAGFDDRNGGIHDDRADQTCAAARNEHVNETVCTHQLGCAVAGGILYQIEHVRRNAAGLQRVTHDGHQALVGAECLLAAAQHAGGARLEAQRRRVHGDIRTRLVDDADDAHRHALDADFESVRRDLHAGDLADRIGQGCHLTAAVRNALNARIVQRQTVDQTLVQTVFASGCDVQCIGGLDVLLVCNQCVRDCVQRTVLFQCAQTAHGILDRAGTGAELNNR